MKRIKKMLSIMLTMVMTLAMCSSVFAANTTTSTALTGPFTITLEGKTSGHVYSAYQVFKGELAQGENPENPNDKLILSNIQWGDGVTNTTALVAKLAEIEGSGITEGMDAAQVAAAIQKQSNDSEVLKKITDIIGKADYLETAKGNSEEGDNFQYTIEVKEPGYYFIKDTGSSISGDGTGTATDYILQVAGAVTIKTKDDVVSLNKAIVSGNGQSVSSNKASIGDNVTYRLTSKVPDYTAYETYFFIMNDTLSTGLTFNNDPVVKVGDATLTRGTDYVVYEGADINTAVSLNEGVAATGQSFKIAFTNIKNYTVGDPIEVTYSARLNENAVIGENGNTNTANLTYSNNPNDSSYGDPSENPNPGLPKDTDNPPLGETPDKVVVTFTTQVAILKTQDGNEKPLSGAEFTLEGISKYTIAESGFKYTEAPDGKYYLLTDGRYTETAPSTEDTMVEAEADAEEGYVVAEEGYTGEDTVTVGETTYRPYKPAEDVGATIYIRVKANSSSYVSTETKYNRETVTTTTENERPIKLVGTSDENGKIIFKGLGEGTFTITETKTPAGFNTAAPVTIVIVGTVTGEGKTAICTWSVGTGSSTDSKGENIFEVRPITDNHHQDNVGDEYYVNIVNNSGSTLPSTGGIGTTIFYIIGGILVVGAAILLVTKKRMSREA